jgi:tRNA1(Val) A37 N6-methylase TrmN6
MHPDMDTTDEATHDRLLDGRLHLRQSRLGYRAGLDAALLAAACEVAPGQTVIEAGCGAGAVLLAAALRRPLARFVGVERDAGALSLAMENIAINDLGDRVSALAGDVGAPFAALGLPPFDAALANPPFFDDPAALRAPRREKAAAWITEHGLAAWMGFLVQAVHQGGAVTLIHRADRLAEILALLAPKMGSVQIRPVQSFADSPAKRVLVRAVKSGKTPLRLLPALVSHARDSDKHTPEVEAILRGKAALGWL